MATRQETVTTTPATATYTNPNTRPSCKSK
jgi:hypothetical protein